MTTNGRVGASAAVYSAAILGRYKAVRFGNCCKDFMFYFIYIDAFFLVNRGSVLTSDIAIYITMASHFLTEYLTAEVLELAGNASKDLKVKYLSYTGPQKYLYGWLLGKSS